MAEYFDIRSGEKIEPKLEPKKSKEDRFFTVSNTHTYSTETLKVDAEEAFKKSSTLLSKDNFVRLFIFDKTISRKTGGFNDKDFYRHCKELEKETIEQLEKRLGNPIDADFYSNPSFTLALVRVLEKKNKENYTK